MAIEKLLGVEVPRRASLIRVLYSELGRIMSHLLNVGTGVMDVGALTPITWCFEEREKLCVFYERASGSRMHAAYFRPEGVHQDLPQNLIDDIAEWCEHFPSLLDQIESLVTENRIFKQRNVDIGVVDEKTIMDWGFSGVMVRGSGFAYGICVGPSHTSATRSSTSRFRLAAMAITMIAMSVAWKRCASR